MANAAGGVAVVPWYATLFRGDKFETALLEIAPVALRYGATSYAVYRADDDRYKFLQASSWKRKDNFVAYWEGPEFRRFRVTCSSWFQVPVLYAWQDISTEGALAEVAEERPGPLPDVA